MKHLIKLATVMLATLVGFTTIGAVSADKLKVGFIYIGPPGDHGLSLIHI